MQQAGKLDGAAAVAEVGSEAALALQAELADIWRETLATDRAIAPTDSFFEIGGHSLAATLVLFDLKLRTGHEVPVQLFFQNPRLADLAVAVLRYRPEETPSEPEPPPAEAAASSRGPCGLSTLDGRPLAPLSDQQRQLWLIERMEGRSSQYTVPLALAINGPVDRERLLAAFRTVVRDHEALRTVYTTVGDEPVQVVTDQVTEPTFDDLSALPPDEGEAAWRRIGRAMAERVFDLGSAPPLAASLVCLAPERHLLLMAFHHIAFDGWSADVFVGALAAAYGGVAATEPTPRYRDLAAAERAALDGRRGTALAEFWRDRLGDLETAADIVPDTPAGFGRRGAAAVVRRTLDAAASEAARQLALHCDTTLFTVLFGAYALLVGRQAGTDDVVIGTPMANRGSREATRAIGFFANSLVLRVKPAADASLRDYLIETGSGIQAAFGCQDMPFPRLVELLRPPRLAGRNPIFNTMFVLQHKPKISGRLGGAEVELLPVDNTVAKFDLLLNVIIRDSEIELEFEYDTALFDHDRIAAMADQYVHLLSAAGTALAQPLKSLDVRPAAERAQQVATFRTAAGPSPFTTIVEAFHAARRRNPQQVAVVEGDRQLTYEEFDRLTDAIAAGLQGRGVGPGDRVGLATGRSLDVVAAGLAVAKAGAVYVPLDPAYPLSRLTFIAEDAALATIVVAPSGGLGDTLRTVPELAGRLVDVATLASSGRTFVPVAGRPADPVYAMYTSGSTGLPKGVAIPHEGILRLVIEPDYVTLGPQTRVMFSSSVAFDLATYEVYAGLLNGGTVVVHPDGPFDIDALMATIETHQVNMMWLTAGAVEGLAARWPRLPASLTCLLAGGDVVPTVPVMRLLAENPQLTVINGYGPTENTTFTCCDTMRRDHDPARPFPIGRPIRGTGAAVVDGTGLPLAVGMPGELVAYGLGVGLGYLNRPELTAERFAPDPAWPGLRVYRTGDLARWRADGRLEFIGRRDGQVKIRGFRVEIGEIETTLRRHPAVAAAAVTVHGREAADKFMVGWIVGAAGTVVDAEAVKGWLAEELPAHLQPSSIVATDDLPLTVNGKLDRRALIARWDLLLKARRQSAATLEAASPVLRGLALLWQELLGLAVLPSPEDEFFALGGHSLAAVRLATRITQRWSIDLPVRVVVERPTLAGLAEAVEAALGGSAAATASDRLITLVSGSADAEPITFCLPGLGASGAIFVPLAQALAAATRADGREPAAVVAIEPRGLADGAPPAATMAEIVDDCRTIIARHRPAGPLRLVGHSFGGRVAFELAAALAAEGRSVSLVLLDALPGHDLVDVRGAGGDLDDRAIARWLTEAALGGATPAPAGDDAIAMLVGAGLATPDRAAALLRLARAQFNVVRSYEPGTRTFAGPTRLIYATQSLIGAQPAAAIERSLRHHCPAAEFGAVAADHFSMLRQGPALASLITAVPTLTP